MTTTTLPLWRLWMLPSLRFLLLLLLLCITPLQAVSPLVAESYVRVRAQHPSLVVAAQDMVIPSSVQLHHDDENDYYYLSNLQENDMIGLPDFVVSLDDATLSTTGVYDVQARVRGAGGFWLYDAVAGTVLLQAEIDQSSESSNDDDAWTVVHLGQVKVDGMTPPPKCRLLVRRSTEDFALQSLTLTTNGVSPRTTVHHQDDMPHTYVWPATAVSNVVGTATPQPDGLAVMGNIHDGDALDYDWTIVSGHAARYYRLSLGLSSSSNGHNIVVLDRRTNQVLTELATVTTASSWATVDLPGVIDMDHDHDDQNTLLLRLVALQGGFELEYLSLSPVDQSSSTTTAKTSTKLFYYAVDSLHAEGALFRSQNWRGSGPGHWAGLDDGDLLAYAIVVPVTGHYQITLGVASEWIGGVVDIILANNDNNDETATDNDEIMPVVGTLDNVPPIPTLDWESFTAVTDDTVRLPLTAGPQVVQLRVRTGGWNLEWLTLELIHEEMS